MKNAEDDFYTVLGLPHRGQGVTMDDIKKAYRKMALKWHPDKHAKSSSSIQKEAEGVFKSVSEAFEVLKDEGSRKKYDLGETPLFEGDYFDDGSFEFELFKRFMREEVMFHASRGFSGFNLYSSGDDDEQYSDDEYYYYDEGEDCWVDEREGLSVEQIRYEENKRKYEEKRAKRDQEQGNKEFRGPSGKTFTEMTDSEIDAFWDNEAAQDEAARKKENGKNGKGKRSAKRKKQKAALAKKEARLKKEQRRQDAAQRNEQLKKQHKAANRVIPGHVSSESDEEDKPGMTPLLDIENQSSGKQKGNANHAKGGNGGNGKGKQGINLNKGKNNSLNEQKNALQIDRQKVQQLVAMGFTNKDNNATALFHTKNDIEAALEYLLLHSSAKADEPTISVAAKSYDKSANVDDGFETVSRRGNNNERAKSNSPVRRKQHVDLDQGNKRTPDRTGHHSKCSTREVLPIGEAPEVIPDNYKTKLCTNIAQRGFCRYGDSCHFAHSTKDLRAFANGQSPRALEDALVAKDNGNAVTRSMRQQQQFDGNCNTDSEQRINGNAPDAAPVPVLASKSLSSAYPALDSTFSEVRNPNDLSQGNDMNGYASTPDVQRGSTGMVERIASNNDPSRRRQAPPPPGFHDEAGNHSNAEVEKGFHRKVNKDTNATSKDTPWASFSDNLRAMASGFGNTNTGGSSVLKRNNTGPDASPYQSSPFLYDMPDTSSALFTPPPAGVNRRVPDEDDKVLNLSPKTSTLPTLPHGSSSLFSGGSETNMDYNVPEGNIFEGDYGFGSTDGVSFSEETGYSNPLPVEDEQPQVPFIGSHISLLSIMDVRYEGTLASVDMTDGTIQLSDVCCFGSEDRNTSGPPIPGSEEIFSMLTFHSQDIKNLEVVKISESSFNNQFLQNSSHGVGKTVEGQENAALSPGSDKSNLLEEKSSKRDRRKSIDNDNMDTLTMNNSKGWNMDENTSVSAFVFVCNNRTEQECLQSGIFANTRNSFKMTKDNIGPGTIIFLINFESKMIRGIFQALCRPALRINQRVSFGSRFPVQVRVAPVGKTCSAALPPGTHRFGPIGPKRSQLYLDILQANYGALKGQLLDKFDDGEESISSNNGVVNSGCAHCLQSKYPRVRDVVSRTHATQNCRRAKR